MAVPRPISSSRISERGVAVLRMVAVSVISTMKVERPRATLSLAPMRVKMRSTTPKRSLAGGNKGAHLRHDDDQRGLAEIGGFAAHVRAGEQQDCLRGGVQIEIVGDEALGSCEFLQPRRPDGGRRRFPDRRLVRARDGSSCASAARWAKRRQQIDFGDRQRGAADARGFGGDGGAQLGEDAPLDFDDLLLRVEDLGFVFLQLGRGEALGVDQRLLALVVGGSEMQVGLGDLDVVAEDGIEPYL